MSSRFYAVPDWYLGTALLLPCVYSTAYCDCRHHDTTIEPTLLALCRRLCACVRWLVLALHRLTTMCELIHTN